MAGVATLSRVTTTQRTSRSGLGPIVAVHAAFLAGGAVALSLDEPAQGWGVLVCVVAYVGALPSPAARRTTPTCSRVTT